MKVRHKVPYIDLISQHKKLRPDLVKAFHAVLNHSNFILGDEVRALEKKIAAYCGTKYAVALNSGTDALFLSLKALGINEHHEVITTPNSFLASASTIVAVGARPIFCDVGSDQNMDPLKLESVITKKTKAIMPVHLTGKVADMRPILKIAGKYKLPVIEDAAQAFGAVYRNKRAGSFGTVGCFSLHPLKTLNACGDAGILTTNDQGVADTVNQLRNIGLQDRGRADLWGYNSRLDTLQAAFILAKFKYLDSWIAKRRKNAEYYRKYLSDLVRCPSEEDYEKPVYHLFVIQTDRRDELQSFLSKHGIDSKIHYPIPIHLQRAAKDLGYRRGDFPVAERQSQRILSLPVYQTLSRAQLKYVVSTIRRFFKVL